MDRIALQEKIEELKKIEEINEDFKNSVITSINTEDNNVVMEPSHNSVHESPNDFEILSVLGKGGYGLVVQVLCKSNRQIYAMKIIKKEVLKMNAEKQFMKTERNILTKINFPFLIKLLCSFQTPKCLYIIMEYCSGGELFHFIEQDCWLKEDVVRFYACEMIVAIEHLHSLNIIHRDLKPENILLDSKGHIYITDFGLAKIKRDMNEKTNTICGTCIYMAPEMIKGGGYGPSVDWWSLGCLFYQMFTGHAPFYNMNIKKLNQEIMNKQPKLPSYLTPEAHSLIKGMLTKDPSKRLGSKASTFTSVGGVSELKKHPFFKSVNWEDVIQKRIPSPFNPTLKSNSNSTPRSPCKTPVIPIDVPAYMGRSHFDSDLICMSYSSYIEGTKHSSDNSQNTSNSSNNEHEDKQNKDINSHPCLTNNEKQTIPTQTQKDSIPINTTNSLHFDDDLFKNFSYVSEEFLNTPVAEDDPNLDIYLSRLKQERENLIKQHKKELKKEEKQIKKQQDKKNKKNKVNDIMNPNNEKLEESQKNDILFTQEPIDIPSSNINEDSLLTKVIKTKK